MLLFVMQPDLDDRRDLGQVVCRLDQPRDRVVDVTTISSDLIGAGARDQAALRPRVAWTGRDIIGIVKIGEALVEDAIILGARPEQELFKKPADMGAMPWLSSFAFDKAENFGRRATVRYSFSLVGRSSGVRPAQAKISFAYSNQEMGTPPPM